MILKSRCKIFKTVTLKKRFVSFISAIYFQNNSKHYKIIKCIITIIIIVLNSQWELKQDFQMLIHIGLTERSFLINGSELIQG